MKISKSEAASYTAITAIVFLNLATSHTNTERATNAACQQDPHYCWLYTATSKLSFQLSSLLELSLASLAAYGAHCLFKPKPSHHEKEKSVAQDTYRASLSS